MTALAQLIVESTWKVDLQRSAKWNKDARLAHAMAVCALQPTGYAARADVISETRATRFVFHEDAPQAIYDYIEAGQIPPPYPFEMARLPAPHVWIEWVHRSSGGDRLQLGVLLSDRPQDMKHGDSIIAIAFAADREHGPDAYCMLTLPALPHSDPNGIMSHVVWKADDDSPEADEQIQSIVREAMYVLFLINTPRVCEIVDVEHPHKLQRARAKSGKMPLIEYKHLTLKIGDGGKRYRTKSETMGEAHRAQSDGRRLHQVIGHFRNCGRDGKPLPRWVPSHWRGDASKGVLIHDRDVKR